MGRTGRHQGRRYKDSQGSLEPAKVDEEEVFWEVQGLLLQAFVVKARKMLLERGSCVRNNILGELM